MELIVIAAQLGITPGALDRFISSGEVPTSFAAKLNTTQASLQDFIDGGSSIGLATKINCTPSAVEKLRQAIGREGAIGFLLGLTASATAPGGESHPPALV